MLLDWNSNEHLLSAVEKLKATAENAVKKAERRRVANVIDPLKSLVVANVFEIQEVSELNRLHDTESGLRGLSNAIGLFHQEILSGVDGWVNWDTGFDLICEQRQIVAEIKNKHNTMNASNRAQVVGELSTAVRQRPGDWEAYLVIIVPKKALAYRESIGRNVYEIDGVSFYRMVTGRSNALQELFDVVCELFNANDEIATYCQSAYTESMPPSVSSSRKS